MPRKSTKRPTHPPQSIMLAADTYDHLRKLTEWYESTPESIELGDHVAEQVWEHQGNAIPERALPKGWRVASIQIETEDNAIVNSTRAGDLIALIEDDTSGERPVVLLRRSG